MCVRNVTCSAIHSGHSPSVRELQLARSQFPVGARSRSRSRSISAPSTSTIQIPRSASSSSFHPNNQQQPNTFDIFQPWPLRLTAGPPDHDNLRTAVHLATSTIAHEFYRNLTQASLRLILARCPPSSVLAARIPASSSPIRYHHSPCLPFQSRVRLTFAPEPV